MQSSLYVSYGGDIFSVSNTSFDDMNSVQLVTSKRVAYGRRSKIWDSFRKRQGYFDRFEDMIQQLLMRFADKGK